MGLDVGEQGQYLHMAAAPSPLFSVRLIEPTK